MAWKLVLAVAIGLAMSLRASCQEWGLRTSLVDQSRFVLSVPASYPSTAIRRLPPLEYETPPRHLREPELFPWDNNESFALLNSRQVPNTSRFTQSPAESSNQERPDSESRRFGQEPEDIRQVFLRQSSSLLSPGTAQWDIGFTYVWNDSDALTVLSDNSIDLQRQRDRQFLTPITWRYGLSDCVEVFATVPLGVSAFERTDIDDGTTTTRAGLGDVGGGLLFQVMRETAVCPDVILGSNFTAPTGAAPFGPSSNIASLGGGFWTLATDVSFVKSYDPVVVFASIGYRHEFSNEFSGTTITPGEVISYSYGLGFSVNDDIALTAELTGEYQREYVVGGRSVPSSNQEPISLRFGFTRRVTSQRSVQPFISVGVTSDAPEVFMGMYFIRSKDSWFGRHH